ncbi:MAG: hypothetical protein ACTSWY_08405 [Promethearchaeota archaeon]
MPMPMFLDFFHLLRGNRIPVSITEYIALIKTLNKGLINSPMEFYYIARSLLVKDEKYFDLYDQVFLHYIKGAQIPLNIHEELKMWLAQPINMLEHKIPRELFDYLRSLDPDALRRKLEEILLMERENKLKNGKKALDNIDERIKRWLGESVDPSVKLEMLRELYDFIGTSNPKELMKRLEELLRTQKERHDGGNKWIGTGGTSPFGWGGRHIGGIRIEGEGGMRMASKIAAKRMFRNYRTDRIINTRSYKVALKKLRKLFREGPEELDIDGTIDKTCKIDEIDIVMQQEKKNTIKLLLLMDAGGSMDPYARLVEQLFSAAHGATHFKDFKYFYFHNCIYQRLYKDMELETNVLLADIIKKYDSDYRVIIIGDAAMAPSELTASSGSIYLFDETRSPGIVFLRQIKNKFPKSVWLNPEIIKGGWKPNTRQLIERIFPMYNLTINGLEEAITTLI